MFRRRRDPLTAELDDELSFHVEETVDRLVAAGWPVADARAEAARRFGDHSRYRRRLGRIDRASRRRDAMRTILSIDLRDALRSLRATPLVTLVAIASLALGIGANTALFSIVNGLMLRPLPVDAPEQLALIEDGSWSHPTWEQVRQRRASLFADALAWSNETFDLAESGEAEPVEGVYASGNLFAVLGLGAVRGRPLLDADDVRGGGPDGPVAVISHALWQQRFDRADNVLGRRLTVNRVPVTIVGVMPRGFLGPEVGRAAHVFVPLALDASIRGHESRLDQPTSSWLNMMVRLAPGQTIDAAAAALNHAAADIRGATVPATWSPDRRAAYLQEPFRLVSAATGRSTLRARFAQPLTIIITVVGVVLLIACANIANLLLARATARRAELSVRIALGASRARLTRQLLAEAFILAATGSAIGMLCAEGAAAMLVAQLGSQVTAVTIDLSLDWRVLAFTTAVTTVTTLLFGLAPAAGLSSLDPNAALKDHGRTTIGERRARLRHGLVVVQVALSLVLTVAAVLFVRTFHTLTTMPLGMTSEDLLLVNVDTQRTAVAPEDRFELYERVVGAVRRVPGAERVSASYTTPLSTRGWNDRVEHPARADLSPQQRVTFQNAIAPGWFATYGMRVLAGRDLTAQDVAGTEPVAVVNETFVKRFLGGPPVGQHIRLNADPHSLVVVGVVNDAVYRSARGGIVPTVYVPLAQVRQLSPAFTVTMAAHADRGGVVRALKDVLSRTDPNLTFSFRDYADQVRSTVAQERLIAVLSGFFGGIALLLAALGLFGVTSYSVNRRRPEIAVRMALGADAGRVLRLVLRRVTLLAIAGVLIGIGLALWASRFVGTLLFDLDARDPQTFAVAAIALVGVALLAGWLPARRASRLDPTTVLRQ